MVNSNHIPHIVIAAFDRRRVFARISVVVIETTPELPLSAEGSRCYQSTTQQC